MHRNFFLPCLPSVNFKSDSIEPPYATLCQQILVFDLNDFIRFYCCSMSFFQDLLFGKKTKTRIFRRLMNLAQGVK